MPARPPLSSGGKPASTPPCGSPICLGAPARSRTGATASEVISPGEANYIRPSHNANIEDDAEFVEFTHADHTPGINTVDLERSGHREAASTDHAGPRPR
ncbi:MAG TPA: hypothetical protein VES02_02780, partial [Dermatophilaceae bacterium]|nr:hypothetical protein [Dermatophilaceae bacterium]